MLLDFSAADTIWHQKLLLYMLVTGVPHAYVKWLFQFLNNRQARVKFNGSISNSRQLHQGFPQGPVLSPLLFKFYINNLAALLPSSNTNCIFLDDVSIHSLQHAQSALGSPSSGQHRGLVVRHLEAQLECQLEQGELF